MAAKPSIDPARLLEEQLAAASPDLLRSLLATFLQALMSAEADVICGAPYRAVSPERVNVRNGYRHRDFDTRAGTMDLAIPRLRSGSYFPGWLLERRSLRCGWCPAQVCSWEGVPCFAVRGRAACWLVQDQCGHVS